MDISVHKTFNSGSVTHDPNHKTMINPIKIINLMLKCYIEKKRMCDGGIAGILKSYEI